MFVYKDLRESGYTKVKLSDKEYKKYINRSQKPLMGVFYDDFGAESQRSLVVG